MVIVSCVAKRLSSFHSATNMSTHLRVRWKIDPLEVVWFYKLLCPMDLQSFRLVAPSYAPPRTVRPDREFFPLNRNPTQHNKHNVTLNSGRLVVGVLLLDSLIPPPVVVLGGRTGSAAITWKLFRLLNLVTALDNQESMVPCAVASSEWYHFLVWTALLEGNADEFTVIANQVSVDPLICNQVHYQGRPLFIITVIISCPETPPSNDPVWDGHWRLATALG